MNDLQWKLVMVMGFLAFLACQTSEPQPDQPKPGWKITHQHTANSNLPGDIISALAIDDLGGIWLAYLAGNIFDNIAYRAPGSNSWEVFSQANGRLPAKTTIEKIIVHPDGTVWAATLEAGLFHYDGSTWNQIDKSSSGLLPGNWVVDIELAPDNRLALVVADAEVPYQYFGILFFDPQTPPAFSLTASNSPLFSNAVEDLAFSPVGDLIIASSPGFHPFNYYDSSGIQRVNSGGWTDWSPQSGFIDRWFKGVFPLGDGQIMVENYTPPSGAPYNWGQHYLFIGNEAGWSRIDGLTGRNFRFATDQQNRLWITSAADPVKWGEPFSGGTWVQTSPGVYQDFNDTVPITDRKVVAPDPQNGVWIGSSAGLFYIREE